ncbi:MAG: hypothetical protein E7311_05450 [Clostridiales bacterium]|nr:hypothetical protein [Clostridiales bacterium]
MLALIILLLLIIVVPIILVVLLVKFLSKDKELFEIKIRHLYCYIVMLISLFINVYSLIYLISSLTDLLLPDPTLSEINYNTYYVDIITCLGALLVCIPVFFRHKNLIEKKK